MPAGRKVTRMPNPQKVQARLFRGSKVFVPSARRWLFAHGISAFDADEVVLQTREKFAQYAKWKEHKKKQAGYFFRALYSEAMQKKREQTFLRKGKRVPREVSSTPLLEADYGREPFRKTGPESYSDIEVRDWLELVEKKASQSNQSKKLLKGLRIFKMRADGFTFKEIAEMEGIPSGTAAWYFSQFKKFLKSEGLAAKLNH